MGRIVACGLAAFVDGAGDDDDSAADDDGEDDADADVEDVSSQGLVSPFSRVCADAVEIDMSLPVVVAEVVAADAAVAVRRDSGT